MLLTRLKYWRTIKGCSVRELAAKSGIDASSISLLENLKRTPHAGTARTLAAALEVEISDLYETVAIPEPVILNANKTQTVTRPRAKKKAAGNFWVIDEEGDSFGPFVKEEAERLKVKLGRARVYETVTKNEARELHRQFLIKVVRGHDAW